jgi:hypothetical protein
MLLGIGRPTITTTMVSDEDITVEKEVEKKVILILALQT